MKSENYLQLLKEIQDSWFPIIIAIIAIAVATIRYYVAGKMCPSNERINGKIVIITGGSSGIGLATAQELVKRGAFVILAIRNARKGKQALDSIKQNCNAQIVAKLVDLSDFNSIRNFADQISNEFERVDILINNAGIIFHPYKKTVNGNELTMTTNYFGPFLLTHLLLPLLNKSENGRVINVSSSAHFSGNIKLDDLNSEKSFTDDAVFAQSKLALTIFTKQMASLLKHTGITVNAVNPGMVHSTGHFRHSKLNTSLFIKILTQPWLMLFLKTPRQGCQTVVYVAVEPLLKNVSGCYFNNCIIEPAAPAVKDIELSEELYKKTCQIVGIDNKKILESLSISVKDKPKEC